MKYRAGVGQGEGCLPSIGGKTMEIRKCLDDLDAKHIFNFKIVKIGPHFFEGGDMLKENGGKKMEIRNA